MKCLVLADDFTGSNDTGVQLSNKGATVDVSFNWEQKVNADCDVLVINTESRAATPEIAKHRLQTCLQNYYDRSHPCLVYKKIDSTFRGNVGAEVEAALLSIDAPIAIVAAAIPKAGRITVDGHCYVHNVLLAQTEFATDPKTPIVSSRIKEIISSQTEIPVIEVCLKKLYEPNFYDDLKALKNGKTIVVVDAKTDFDLQQLTKVLTDLPFSYLLVGAAGLAGALPERLFINDSKEPKAALVIAGSMSEKTYEQVEFASTVLPMKVLDLDVECLLSDNNSEYVSKMIKQAVDVLRKGRHCVVNTVSSSEDRMRIVELCERYHISRKDLGDKISLSIAKMTRDILEQFNVSGLFLTGGDMAIAVASSLNAKGYRIKGEVLPCIPYGHFMYGDELRCNDLTQLPVITKAGGFGDKTALKDALLFFMEN